MSADRKSSLGRRRVLTSLRVGVVVAAVVFASFAWTANSFWTRSAKAQDPTPAAELQTSAEQQNPAQQLSTAPGTLNAQAISKQLFAATVTVRSASNKAPEVDGLDKDMEELEMPQLNPLKVLVSSGVSLGDGLVITFSAALPKAEYRITLPNGDQVTARLRVMDYYSGLRLLEIENQDIPHLDASEAPPEVGEAILSASAAGIEKPVLALGMLSATERTLSGTDLPPLYQCDLPNTDTSSGAAVVNSAGQLIGIIAVTGGEAGNDWTYVVPVSHALRLRTAYKESNEEDRQAGKVVILRHRRPHVGMTLEVGEQVGEVLVEHVDENGPAHKAGLRPGMEVISCEGIPAESVYAVVGMVLKKQPGDFLELVVRDGDSEKPVRLALEGGELVEPSGIAQENGLYTRNLRIGADRFEFVRPLSVDGDEDVPDELQQVMQLVELLQRQKTLFAEYIDRLRKENQTLRDENADLKRRLDNQEPLDNNELDDKR